MNKQSQKILTLVGNRIKTQREFANISQEDLGKWAGLSQSKVGRLELGKTDNLDIVAVEQIADALKIPLGVFLNDLVEAQEMPESLQDFIKWISSKRFSKSQLKKVRVLIELLLSEEEADVYNISYPDLARQLISTFYPNVNLRSNLLCSKVLEFSIPFLAKNVEADVDIEYKSIADLEAHANIEIHRDSFYVYIEQLLEPIPYDKAYQKGITHQVVVFTLPSSDYSIFSHYHWVAEQLLRDFPTLTLEKTHWYAAHYNGITDGKLFRMEYISAFEDVKIIRAIELRMTLVAEERLHKSTAQLRQGVYDSINEGNTAKKN